MNTVQRRWFNPNRNQPVVAANAGVGTWDRQLASPPPRHSTTPPNSGTQDTVLRERQQNAEPQLARQRHTPRQQSEPPGHVSAFTASKLLFDQIRANAEEVRLEGERYTEEARDKQQQ
jgi:hypothetical protein